MDQIHHPGSSNKCWIQEKWRQPCFLNRPIAAVDTPQKIHNLNLEWLKIEIVIVRGGGVHSPNRSFHDPNRSFHDPSRSFHGLSMVCPRFWFFFSLFKKRFLTCLNRSFTVPQTSLKPFCQTCSWNLNWLVPWPSHGNKRQPKVPYINLIR